MNLLPSEGNISEELKNFIVEENIDCAFISESHDRENKKLVDHFNLEDHILL